MNHNIKALIEACQLLGKSYKIQHVSENLVTVQGKHLFVNWSTPLNSQSAARVCTDKDYSHSLVSPVIPMPKSKAFVSPFVEQNFEEYVSEKNLESIAAKLLAEFSLPVIIKPNGGSHAVNVFCCYSPEEVMLAVRSVFDVESKDYDYVLIAQEFVPCKQEYRVLWLDGQVKFAYQKGLSWSVSTEQRRAERLADAQADLVTDAEQIARFQEFLAPLTVVGGLRYCGLDVLERVDGTLCLIELNGSPGFDFFIRSNGMSLVVELYQDLLEALP